SSRALSRAASPTASRARMSSAAAIVVPPYAQDWRSRRSARRRFRRFSATRYADPNGRERRKKSRAEARATRISAPYSNGHRAPRLSASPAAGELDAGPAGGAQLVLLIALFELALDHAGLGAGHLAAAGQGVAGDRDAAVLPAEVGHPRARPRPIRHHLEEKRSVQMCLDQDVGIALTQRVRLVVVDAVGVPGDGAEAEELGGGGMFDQRRERGADLDVFEVQLIGHGPCSRFSAR